MPKLIMVALSIYLLAAAGCGAVKSVSPRYEEPTTGQRARVRVVGLTPHVFAAECPTRDAKPSGRLADWGVGAKLGKRSLGMPRQAAFGDEDYAEIYVPAGAPLTITFGGTYQSAQGPYTKVCTSRVTFTPQEGKDYEVRQAAGGFCVDGAAELITTPQGTVLSPVAQINNQCRMSIL
ncbi:hypothetical protein [Dyella sp. C9]|uniref:hypothetical protein n=1 Tax=Dyella sp. C9 TaxID=2202154 RepID=UPI0013009063|nr:hypothetical protein [Dyella sp. C9]